MQFQKITRRDAITGAGAAAGAIAIAGPALASGQAILKGPSSSASAEVIPFRELHAKVVPFDEKGPFTFPTWAFTDEIGGTVYNTIYREERVWVDPDAELEDGCLVVTQFEHGTPHMRSWRRTGRDINGRFIPAGDPREAFSLGHFSYTAKYLQSKWLRILGRVVEAPRTV